MQLPIDIVVVPRSKVGAHLLSKSKGPLYKSMVSIGDPGTRYPSGYKAVGARLRLEFEDIEDEANPLAPRARDIDALLAFAPTASRVGGRCLIHCEAGISRSTAAAIIILRAVVGPGSEPFAVSLVRSLVPAASPNRLMMALADQRLAPEGRIAEAWSALASMSP